MKAWKPLEMRMWKEGSLQSLFCAVVISYARKILLTRVQSEEFPKSQPLLVSEKVLQYTSNLYGSTPRICIAVPPWRLNLKKGNPTVHLPFVLQYASHLYGSMPPICTAVCLPFVRQYFWEVLGVGSPESSWLKISESLRTGSVELKARLQGYCYSLFCSNRSSCLEVLGGQCFEEVPLYPKHGRNAATYSGLKSFPSHSSPWGAYFHTTSVGTQSITQSFFGRACRNWILQLW